MKNIVNLSTVVVIACMMIAFYTVNITTYANEEVRYECVQCGKPADSHGGAIMVEQDAERLIFCCPECIDKHKKGYQSESNEEDMHHDPGEQKDYDKYKDYGKY